MGRESKIKQLRKQGVLEPVKLDKKRASTLKKIFIWIPSIIILVCFIFGIWAYSAKNIEATVRGHKITSSTVDQMLENVKSNMRQQGMDPDAEEQAPTILQYRNDIINMLVEQKLFEVYAKENKISVNKDDLAKKVQEEIDNIKKQYATEKEFIDALAKTGLKNLDTLKKEIETSITPTLLEEAILKPLYDEIKITEQDAEIYFNSPSQIEAKRILIALAENATEEQTKAAEKKATDTKDQLIKKEISFEKAVETVSEDTATKSNGGNMTLYENALPNEPELFETAKKMNIGEISGVVKTKSGYSIITVQSKSFVKERYNTPESASIKKIIIAVAATASDTEKAEALKKAQGLAKTLQAGKEKFEVIADSYSETPDYGKNPQTVYMGQVSAEANDVLFKTLKPGQISDPILNGTNYEIYQLISKKPAVIAVFKNMKDKVIEEMTSTAKNKARANWVQEQKDLKKPSFGNPWNRLVSIYDNTLGAFFEDVGNFIKAYTVEPKPATTDQAAGDGQTLTIPSGDGGQPLEVPITDEMTQGLTNGATQENNP